MILKQDVPLKETDVLECWGPREEKARDPGEGKEEVEGLGSDLPGSRREGMMKNRAARGWGFNEGDSFISGSLYTLSSSALFRLDKKKFFKKLEFQNWNFV